MDAHVSTVLSGVRSGLNFHFLGRGYSEAWELFSASNALICDDLNQLPPPFNFKDTSARPGINNAVTQGTFNPACRQPAVKEETSAKDKDEPVRRYAMHGEVLRLDADGKIAAIKAGKIGDWMEAMTMEYPVKDAVEFASLHVGDHITATVSVQDLNYWISGIHPFR